MGTNHCQTLIDKLLFRAATQPNEPLYYFLDGRGNVIETLTYGRLLTAVQTLGEWLTERTELGDRVAIQLPTGAEFVITFFACLYTARIPVPLSLPNRKYQGDYYQKIFADCSARLVVTHSSIGNLFESLELPDCTTLELFPSWLLSDHQDTAVDIHRLKTSCRARHDVAFLQYTSGSTSFPKGVKVSHQNIMANQRMIEYAFGHSKQSIGLAWVPLFHDMGLIGSVIQPLYVGFPCYFMTPMTFVKRPKLWLDLIEDKQITTTGGPNFAYDLCVKRVKPESLSKTALNSWDVAYNGAEDIRLSSLEKFIQTFGPNGFQESAFLPCYGLAEATLIVSGVNKSEAPKAISIDCSHNDFLETDASHRRTVVSSGQVMPDLTLKIMETQTHQECLPDHVGEIWVAGESITQGYWHKPQKNSETFVFQDGLHFLKTGDLGFLTVERELYITGRLKDLIIIDGINYYPQDIEETAQQSHPALNHSRAAVFSITNAMIQELVVVCEVDRPFSLAIHLHIHDIKAAVRDAVYDRYQLKVHETVLMPSNSIPKTTSGKIQRQRTKLLYLVEQLPRLSILSSDQSQSKALVPIN